MDDKLQQNTLQDPDYEKVTPTPRKKQVLEEQKIEKVCTIINKEFSFEIEKKERDINIIDQRLLLAKKTLHKLRYAVVNNYYNSKQFQFNEDDVRKEIICQKDPIARTKILNLLKDDQKRIHPALKKLLGKTSDVELDDLFKIRPPRKRNKACINEEPSTSKHLTIAVDGTQDILQSQTLIQIKSEPLETDSNNVKIPRYIEPKDLEKNVLKIDTAIRNKQKEKFRIIIGNTSKYTPPHSEMDRSTHRWLLYVRGPRDRPDVSHFIESVTVTLDNSYAPHNIIKLNSSPFHLSRRGWGEFAVNLQISFKNERLNKPVNLVHNLKLDRNYTGLQTLGGETVADVWLYSDETMKDKPQVSSGRTQVSQNTNNTMKNNYNSSTHREVDILHAQHNMTSDSRTNNMSCSGVIIKTEPMDVSDVDKENVVVSHHLDENNILEENKMLDVRIKQEICSPIKNNPAAKSTLTAKTSKCIIKTHPNSLLKISKMTQAKCSKTSGDIQYPGSEINSKYLANIEALLEDHCYVKGSHLLHTLTANVNLSKWYENKNMHYADEINQTSESSKESVTQGDNAETLVTSILLHLETNIKKVDNIRSAVSILLKKMPLIHEMAGVKEFNAVFPYTVRTVEEYFKLHFIKRRNLEWTRAKYVKDLLKYYWTSPNNLTVKIWSVKQIILFSHYHGFFPVRNQIMINNQDADGIQLDNIKSTNFMMPHDNTNNSDRFQSVEQIYSLSEINYYKTEELNVKQEPQSDFNQCVLSNVKCELDYGSLSLPNNGDDEVDVCSVDEKHREDKKQALTAETINVNTDVLPFTDRDQQLMCSFIEKTCAKQGIILKNEDVVNGYSDCLVHKALLSSVKSFIEDILRRSLAVKMSSLDFVKFKTPPWERTEDGLPHTVGFRHVYEAINRKPEFDILTNSGLGTKQIDYSESL